MANMRNRTTRQQQRIGRTGPLGSMLTRACFVADARMLASDVIRSMVSDSCASDVIGERGVPPIWGYTRRIDIRPLNISDTQGVYPILIPRVAPLQ